MTTCVDFDGVVHSYSLGWNGGEIYDEPVPGAIEALRALLAAGPVVIFTARRDLEAVASWLRDRDVPAIAEQPVRYPALHVQFWRDRTTILVTNRKLPAQVYVDDRGVTFKNWEQTLYVLKVLGHVTRETVEEWEDATRRPGDIAADAPEELYEDLPTRKFVITANAAGQPSLTCEEITRYLRAVRTTLLTHAAEDTGLSPDPRQLAVDLAELLRLEADNLECRAVAFSSDM